ncbi:MAG: hypothetical protein ACSLFP_08520 [Acidimicrobiales bacterium]
MAAAAVVATGGMAAVVEAAPGSPMVTAPAVAGAPAPTAPRTQSTLPEVSVHDIDPAQLAAVRSAGASGGGGQSVVQTIRLNVIGGELELVTDRATVVLQKVPGSKREWVGTLPAVRVIDARGTHAGWAVRWSVESIDLHGANGPGRVPAALVRLEPGAPVVVAGTSDGLASGKGGPSVRKGRTLFSAEPGSGGGTYEAGGSLSLRLPANLSPDQVTLVLSFSLG